MTRRQQTRGDKTALGGAWDGRWRCSHHPTEASPVLPPRITAWPTMIQAPLPPLRQPPAPVWARWRLGMGRARAGALTTVSVFLAPWLGRTAPAGSQPGRAVCSEAAAHRGASRGARAVEPGLLPL